MGETTDPIRVLHVDDEPSLTDVVATFLERENERFSVETATDADEGLAHLDAADVDCIVSDYEMPGQNGIEFLEAVRERAPNLPFILYTGKGSEEVASEAISAGVTDYLQKESGTGQYTILANRIENAVAQHRSRSALEASQKRLSLFIDQSPLGVLEYNEEFEIVGLNAKGEEILGYSEAELRGHTWKKIVTDDSYDNVDSVTDKLADATGGFHSIDENVRKDGERIVCEWHNRVVTDDDGDVVAIFSQFQDVTERKQREDRLRETTARLQALFEESPDMINIHDTEGNIINPNPQLCDMTGYDAETLTDMKVWELDLQLDPSEARSVWEDMERGDQQRLESEYQRKDGTSFPVEVHIRRVELEDGDRFVVIGRDISERKQREAEFEETNTVLSTFVDTLPVGVLAEDAGRNVLATNARLFELFGLSGTPDGIVGADCEQLATELSTLFADPGRFVERIDEIIAEGDPVHNEQLELQDGRTFARSYEPLDLPTGAGHLWVYNDISDQKQRERQLEGQNQRLEEFASVVSHDLRNPLNVAQARLELAQDESDSEHIEAAATAVDRSQALVDDLLTLARNGDDVGTVEPVDLSTLAETCWDNVQTDDATLRTTGKVTVRADRTRLQQLLENLLRNAVEHGSTSPASSDDASGVTVTVGALADGFYVEDDGAGIPAEHREEIFDTGYSTSTGGTGFGLRIVQQVAEAHGWDIAVTEGTAGGARFQITGVDLVE